MSFRVSIQKKDTKKPVVSEISLSQLHNSLDCLREMSEKKAHIKLNRYFFLTFV